MTVLQFTRARSDEDRPPNPPPLRPAAVMPRPVYEVILARPNLQLILRAPSAPGESAKEVAP